MATTASLTVIDDSNETSTMSLRPEPAVSGSAAAVAIRQLFVNLKAAGYVNGGARKATGSFVATYSDNPTADSARELKWLVSYQDTTQYFDDPDNSIPNPGYLRNYSFEIPTADPAGSMPGSDRANLADVAWAAFVAAVEADYRSPNGGAIDIQSIRLVGRAI